MRLEEALCMELEQIPQLAGKVYPLRAPESEGAPYLVYASSEGKQYRTLDGFISSTREVSIELNLLVNDYVELKDLSVLLIDVLKSFQGRSIGTGGPFIQAISYDDPVELYEPEVGLFRCLITVNIEQ